MKTTLTAKLKLLPTPDQFRALRATQLAYRAALNQVSAYSFAHGKTSSGKRLQKATYADLRRQFGLPAQMACNVPRQVGSTYQALWTKAIKNAEARRLGTPNGASRAWTKHPTMSRRRSRTIWAAIIPYAGQQVSLLTLRGASTSPIRAGIAMWPYFRRGRPLGAAKLWYDRSKQRFYLLVSLRSKRLIPPQNLSPDHWHRCWSRYLATVSTLDNGAEFYSRRGDTRQGGPLRQPAKATSAKGHSLGHTAQNRARPARETAKAEYQPRASANTPGYPHASSGWKSDWHSRAHETPHTPPERQAAFPCPEGTQSQSTASKWAFAELQELARL